MQQRMSMGLRNAGVGELNLVDGDPALPGSHWTTGATLIDSIAIDPPLLETWTVLAWTFTFAGGWTVGAAAGPSFGKLGALWAGLLLGGASPTNSPASPWVNPMLPLPADLATFLKVWDGSVDPMFPAVSSAPPRTPTVVSGSAELNLSSPIAIRSGTPLLFGLWLTPSLVQSTLLEIGQSHLAIVYDDGKPPPA